MTTCVSSCTICNSAIIPKSHRANIAADEVSLGLYPFLWTLSAFSLTMEKRINMAVMRKFVKARLPIPAVLPL